MDHHSDEREQVNGARDVEYGLRDVRRRTTYEHRGSSSLTPGQTMLVMDILFLRSSIRISYRDGANSVRVHSVTFICPPMGGNNG